MVASKIQKSAAAVAEFRILNLGSNNNLHVVEKWPVLKNNEIGLVNLSQHFLGQFYKKKKGIHIYIYTYIYIYVY